MLPGYVGAVLAAIIAAKTAPAQMMIRLSLSVVLMLISHAAIALDSVSLNVGTIESTGWKLQGIQITLSDLAKNPQKLALTINQLSLPLPFDDLNLINIHCSSFTWQNKELLCAQGHAQISSKRWQSPAANFSFHIREKHSTLKFTDLQVAGGVVSIEADELDNQWEIQINAKALDSVLIQKLFQPADFELKGGHINFKLNASGSHALIDNFSLTTRLNGLTGQTRDGRFATEALILDTKLEVQNNKDLWQWQSHSRFKGGALYIEPLYLEADGQPMILDAQGNWNPINKQAEIKSASYKHAAALALKGSAIVKYDKKIKLEKADLSLQSDDLQKLSTIYLKSFFEQTALQGLTLAGTLNTDLSIVQNSVTALTATVNKFAVKDEAERIKVDGGIGTINWSNSEAFNQPSTLAWQQIQVHALPIGPSRISFLSRASSFTLLEKTHLPFLGGVIAINQLGWQGKKQQEPDVYFAGSLNNISMEQWSKALNWTPLSGTISGNIPRVEYSNKTL
ncbi:MAG TPA: C4-dicarboxylate ABC transporter, partial [Methylococcales bacterium]